MKKKRRKRTYTYVKGATKPFIRFRFKVVVIIFVIVTVACFAIYMTGVNFGGDGEGSYTVTWDEKKEEETTTEKNKSTEAQEDPLEAVNPVPESETVSQTYLSKCMFIGDSIAAGFADYKVMPVTNVIASSDMSLDKINTDTMETQYGDVTAVEAIKQGKPENVYIFMGNDGIAWMSIDEMITEYSKFASSVKQAVPEAKIYILSATPLTADADMTTDGFSNADITEYNSRLLDLANQNGYYYVDIYSAVANADGVLSAEEAADDGMHFSSAVYGKIKSYILSHVVQ